jgi:hypothetical protein
LASLSTSVLDGVELCPYCGVANPAFFGLWISEQPVSRATRGPIFSWATFGCRSCGGVVLAKGNAYANPASAEVEEIIPAPKTAHEDIPELPRNYLQQAFRTLHAPDAAAVMAGSAVDAMLKELGYTEGSVYVRINKAVEDHALTKSMGDWAHEVRLGANRPRHADNERPHVSAEEAKQSVEFAEALGLFLFVLTKRIERGTEDAKKASIGEVEKQ